MVTIFNLYMLLLVISLLCLLKQPLGQKREQLKCYNSFSFYFYGSVTNMEHVSIHLYFSVYEIFNHIEIIISQIVIYSSSMPSVDKQTQILTSIFFQ